METIKTKDELFQTICNASMLGNLGFFIGAGFSKAVLDGNSDYPTYRWGELLLQCCNDLGIDKDIMSSNCSYPEMATKICEELAMLKGVSYEEAVSILKRKVGILTNIYPYREKRECYEKWFKTLDPSWITTTNYDMVIESILGGIALPISPSRCFCNIKGMIPVYHIHGICNDPDGIVITNEDYASVFRPNDYRQARLPFLIKESCVLMMGYRLGDINVYTAVDFANNVYTNNTEEYDFPIIQLIRKDNPAEDIYESKEGIIILEIKSLESFFAEICVFMEEYKERYKDKSNEVANLIKYLNDTEEDNISDFIEGKTYSLKGILDFLGKLETEFGYVYNNFFSFIRHVIMKYDADSCAYGNFEAYNDKICLILDILKAIPIKRIPPSFFAMLAHALNEVCIYVENDGNHKKGYSYSATDSWQRNKKLLSQEVIDALWRFVKSGKYSYSYLHSLLISMEQDSSVEEDST